MSEFTLIRYRLKPSKKEAVYEWTETVRSRREEAIQTLKDEAIYLEAAFLESRQDGDYICFIMEADDLEAAQKSAEQSSHDIDREFQQLLTEIIAEEQPSEEIDPLYLLKNPNRS